MAYEERLPWWTFVAGCWEARSPMLGKESRLDRTKYKSCLSSSLKNAYGLHKSLLRQEENVPRKTTGKPVKHHHSYDRHFFTVHTAVKSVHFCIFLRTFKTLSAHDLAWSERCENTHSGSNENVVPMLWNLIFSIISRVIKQSQGNRFLRFMMFLRVSARLWLWTSILSTEAKINVPFKWKMISVTFCIVS